MFNALKVSEDCHYGAGVLVCFSTRFEPFYVDICRLMQQFCGVSYNTNNPFARWILSQRKTKGATNFGFLQFLAIFRGVSGFLCLVTHHNSPAHTALSRESGEQLAGLTGQDGGVMGWKVLFHPTRDDCQEALTYNQKPPFPPILRVQMLLGVP